MSVDVEQSSDQRIATLLERVVALRSDKDKLEGELKGIKRQLEQLEQLAVESLAASGLDGVRAAGKSWYTREFFSVSIPAENKDKVLAAAQRACPEYVTVNTSSLKAWLMENRRAGVADAASLAAGTPFDGLISEYREVRLSHVTVG
jgi:hypothetical protein